MNKSMLCKLGLPVLAALLFFTGAELYSSSAANVAGVRFNITYPASVGNEGLDGRLLLLISTNNESEPRLQISEDLTTQQVFGIDVDGWKTGETKTSRSERVRISIAQSRGAQTRRVLGTGFTASVRNLQTL